jgi:ornithine cyclodeaminase
MSDMVIAEPKFCVVSGRQVKELISHRQREVVSVIESAYCQHFAGNTVNPDSYFLRFPDSQTNRIIALPAHITNLNGAGSATTGIKWISSFPGNIERGLPRASAVLIVNDAETGYPKACIEASIISAARTAASAASMVKVHFASSPTKAVKLAIVGAGVISRYVVDFIKAIGIEIIGVRVHDLKSQYSHAMVERLSFEGQVDIRVSESVEEAIQFGEIVLFATSAGFPHVHDSALFAHNPLVLHLSLRDLSPSIIGESYNVVDDVDHCMKAQTSLHLTEAEWKDRSFISASLPEMLVTGKELRRDRPTIFSPFGMGILDLALAQYILNALGDEASVVNDFFFDLNRV